MSAAALLASTVSASAGERNFTFGTAGGAAYCDGGTGNWSGKLYGWIHTNADCAGAVFPGGPGIEGKTSQIGNNINMFDTAELKFSSAYCSVDFPPKFKIGGTYTVVCLVDGIAEETGSGVLLPPTPYHRVAGERKSLAAAVMNVVAELRNKRVPQ